MPLVSSTRMNQPMRPAVTPSAEPRRRSGGDVGTRGDYPAAVVAHASPPPSVEDVTDAAAERERLTWDGFGEASRDIAREIIADGFVPEVVIAIARAGLLPAGAIAYGLGIKNCGAINVEFYTGIGTVLDAPELLPPELDMSYLEGRRVLLVDDVADSGRTLDLAVRLLTERGA